MVGASKSETGGGGRIRYGMVGGGQGAFIGAVHRIAAHGQRLRAGGRRALGKCRARQGGSKGGPEWVQADPNYLWYTPFGQPKQLLTRNGAGALPVAERVSRVPSSQPEGYLEGFANIYQEAARAIRAAHEGRVSDHR